MAFLEAVWSALAVLLKILLQVAAILLTSLLAIAAFIVGLIVFLIGIVRLAGKRSEAKSFIKVGLIIMAVSVVLWFLGRLI